VITSRRAQGSPALFLKGLMALWRKFDSDYDPPESESNHIPRRGTHDLVAHTVPPFPEIPPDAETSGGSCFYSRHCLGSLSWFLFSLQLDTFLFEIFFRHFNQKHLFLLIPTSGHGSRVRYINSNILKKRTRSEAASVTFIPGTYFVGASIFFGNWSHANESPFFVPQQEHILNRILLKQCSGCFIKSESSISCKGNSRTPSIVDFPRKDLKRHILSPPFSYYFAWCRHNITSILDYNKKILSSLRYALTCNVHTITSGIIVSLFCIYISIREEIA